MSSIKKEQSKIDLIRAKLIEAEQTGFTDSDQNEILVQSKEGLT